MKIVISVLATALIVSSLYIVLAISQLVLYGPKMIGLLLSIILMGREISPEVLQLETSFSRGFTAFAFAAFAYHAIFRFAFHFIEASTIKIAGAVTAFFFVFLNMPAEVLQTFDSTLLSWSIYLLSLGILGYHLWARMEELKWGKAAQLLKEEASSGG